MKQNQVSISFVGVFSAPMQIPMLDLNFLNNFFGKAGSAFATATPMGLIVRDRESPGPAVAITPQKIIISATDLDKLVEYIKGLQSGIPKYEFAAYGLNQEIEWLELEKPVKEWMVDKFISSDLKDKDGSVTCGKVNLQYTINKNEQLYLDFEPRMNEDKGMFGAINHHNQYAISGFPNEERLRHLFSDSKGKVNSYLNALML